MSTSSANLKKRKVEDATDDEQPMKDPTPQELLKELHAVKAEVKELKQQLFDALLRITKEGGQETKTEAKASAATQEEEGDFSDLEEEDPNDPWMARYKELREYRILHGDCNVSKKGPHAKLGKWVDNQRCSYKNVQMNKKGSRITPERINKLEALGFTWGKGSPAPLTFEEGLEKLKEFQKAMRHCNVSVNPKSPSDIGKWVSAQRNEYRRFIKGSDSLLTLEQIGELKDLGFQFKGPRLP
jgi:Helicase associated domain